MMKHLSVAGSLNKSIRSSVKLAPSGVPAQPVLGGAWIQAYNLITSQ